ncbi:hypothetical protein WG922_12725 [Ramlibacter sp. AN1015]|uniref:hypothetical protein n=1 Tax=Ramlibacter sp. AN1015 TaxID=3133428 RepID=UPI0030C64727
MPIDPRSTSVSQARHLQSPAASQPPKGLLAQLRQSYAKFSARLVAFQRRLPRLSLDALSLVPQSRGQRFTALVRKGFDDIGREGRAAVNFKVPAAAGHKGMELQIHKDFVKDLERDTYRFGPDDKPSLNINQTTSINSPERTAAVQEALRELRNHLGSDELLYAVTHVAHQGGMAPLQKALTHETTPILDKEQPVVLMPAEEECSYSIQRVAPGRAQIDFVLTRTAIGMYPAGLTQIGGEDVTALDPSRSMMTATMSVMVGADMPPRLLGPIRFTRHIEPQPVLLHPPV